MQPCVIRHDLCSLPSAFCLLPSAVLALSSAYTRHRVLQWSKPPRCVFSRRKYLRTFESSVPGKLFSPGSISFLRNKNLEQEHRDVMRVPCIACVRTFIYSQMPGCVWVRTRTDIGGQARGICIRAYTVGTVGRCMNLAAAHACA